MRHFNRKLHVCVAALLIILSAGCKKDNDQNPGLQVIEVSGNNQLGFSDFPLEEPIAVRVVDKNGQPVKGALVFYKVTHGKGRIYPGPLLQTDENGYAGAHWDLDETAQQTLEVTVTTAAGQVINKMPLVFRAGMKAFFVTGEDFAGNGNSHFKFPSDLTADAAGNLYIVDNGNHRIEKWNAADKSLTTVAGGNGQGSAPHQLHYPSDIFLDREGNLYISDTWNNRVQKWAPGAGSGITVAGGNGAGNGAHQLSQPKAIYVDATGNIFIADRDNHRVQKWAPGATSGVTVIAGLYEPSALCLDDQGNIYVSTGSYHIGVEVQKWAPGATAGTVVAGGTYGHVSPADIFLDNTGAMYIADGAQNGIRRWGPGLPDGKLVAGGPRGGVSGGNALYLFNGVGGVYVNQEGHMFVSDVQNHRIMKWLP